MLGGGGALLLAEGTWWTGRTGSHLGEALILAEGIHQVWWCHELLGMGSGEG